MASSYQDNAGASRATTNLALKRKEGPGNVLGGTYQSKRANLATDVFTRGASSMIGPAGPQRALPQAVTAATRQSRPNFRNVPVRFDASGAVYQQGNERIPIGGNSAADNAIMLRTALGSSLTPPRFGVAAPMLNQWSRDAATALPVAGGMPALQDFAIRGQSFANRDTIALRGMPMEKPAYFDSYNPSVERPVVNSIGSESEALFINQRESDASRGRLMGAGDPFRNFAWDAASSNVSSSTKDTFGANPIAKYTVTASAVAAAYMRSEQLGQMMFMAIELSPTPGSGGKTTGANGFGLDRAIPRHSVYALAVVNYLLHCSQGFPESVDDVVSVARVMDSFRFVGFAAAESGASETRYLDPAASSPARTRNVVLQMAGELQMRNVVGHVPYGHWFGFIVKGVPIDEIYAQNSSETPSYNINASEPNQIEVCVAQDGRRLSQVPIQFVPWYDTKRNHRHPRMEELVYYDDFGLQRIGKYIEVGFITDEPQRRDLATIARTPFSANAALHSGALRVNIMISAV